MSKTPAQDNAVWYVTHTFDGAAPSMCALADQLGPSRPRAYQAIHRAIKAKRLAIDPEHPKRARNGKGAVVLGPLA